MPMNFTYLCYNKFIYPVYLTIMIQFRIIYILRHFIPVDNKFVL
jgi:hypothetical protein